MKRMICVALLSTGCDSPLSRPRYKQEMVPAAASEEHQAWVLACIANGNPMSDEEGEDLVEQCEQTAFRMFAPTLTRKCWKWHAQESGGKWLDVPCSEADAHEKALEVVDADAG